MIAALGATAASAQLLPLASSSKQADSRTSFDQFLDDARKAGSTVIVVQPQQSKAEEPPAMSMATALSSEQLLVARQKLRGMIANSAGFLKNFDDMLKASSPQGTLTWILVAVGTAFSGLFLGLETYRFTTGWAREHFKELYHPNETRRSRKLSFLLGRAAVMLLSTGISVVVAMGVALIFDTGHEPTRQTTFLIISVFAIYRIVRSVILWNFYAPDTPAHRLINVDDEAARRLHRDWSLVAAVAAFLIGFCRWMQLLGIDNDAYRLAFIVAMLICAIMFSAVAILHRREGHAIFLGAGDPAAKPAWQRFVARAALPLILAYFGIAWFVSSLRLILGFPGGYVLVGAPMLVFVVAIFIYGVAILLLDTIYERLELSFYRRLAREEEADRRASQREEAAKKKLAALSEHERDILEEGEEITVFKPELLVKRPRQQRFNPVFKHFFENAVFAVVLVLSMGMLARLWGIELGREGGHPVSATLDILLVIFVAASAYSAVNNYIDLKIVEEGGSLEDRPFNPGDNDGESGKGQSRLATLLPIFRYAIVALIVVVAAMIVLANLGVAIGPLFAGAGVVGIAIGFGAQTLIRDIFSGAFFLLDDAFRKGEYIEVAGAKGVVEKISIRSFQLRHHRGAVNTIPFGEIRQLTNYSRDWVMMKLPLRLTYDTDVEKVRKLIKKLGQQLLEDPVIGKMFLQPLKSQGVYAMEDSAMIVRVKFMTRPGDQFVTRKVIYAAIRELFQQEGIHFAHREVTVRLADGEHIDDLTPEQREAVTGAARAVLDEPQPKRSVSIAR
ncbi:MAG TPA: mechanosensitive ion channel domain-containing protein [Rhizobiaceae bacterium]|nr:mechanosensitive ion channel domain-containing protein [Rhizobiaceae bacterium]